jgi:hypothetical protein
MKQVIPGPTYKVKVAALNQVGVAMMSEPSNAVSTACEKGSAAKAVIFGQGQKEEDGHQRAEAAVVMDIASQTTSCAIHAEHRNLFEAESWSAHFSLPIKIFGHAIWDWTGQSNVQLSGKIAVVQRDEEPLVFKARKVQKAGGIGMIVLDVENRCHDTFDQECIPGATKSLGERWGRTDNKAMWKHIHLPMLIVRQNVSQHLQECIRYKKVRDEL